MKESFKCPENKGYTLAVDNDDEATLISILTPWKDKFRQEYIVCLDGDELQRFKEAVARL